jgi:hypothetical protein
MKRFSKISITFFVLLNFSLLSIPAKAQQQAASIPSDEITALSTKLKEAGESASTARKKLAVRRVIRECEALIEKHPAAPNRYEVLHALFNSQQLLVNLDNSEENRKDFIATCEKLAAAPNEFAALRLDADLLLTQAKSARDGADSHARSDALRPLVERYQDTEVEAKVLRIAMIMALEFGNTKLVNDLRNVIAERLPGNMDLINFQREKLAGQVFGVPFIGNFPRSDGKTVQFPMDFLGTTTVLYCWSKEDSLDDLKSLAVAWKAAKVEHKPAGRFQFVSMNMDDLPDAGEEILRGLGLDWQALKMPKGKDNPIYQTYIERGTPTVLTMSPTGYVALYETGDRNSPGARSYDRALQSMMASSWAHARYTSPLQSFFSAEFLVIPTNENFDPAAPPEYQAIASGDPAKQAKLPRSAECVPEEKLQAIQECFILPPFRYSMPYDQVVANYEKAESLCREAISEYPQAPDLWIVRNRLISALMGLWKSRCDLQAFDSAVAEANALLEGSHPPGTDVIARLCVARQALREPEAKPKEIIANFIKESGGEKASAPALTAASLLALDTGDRVHHDQYRRTFLNNYANHPTMWTATAFFLDRYHRYWLYQPPFMAGWTYGRRLGYFLSIGTPEEAKRTFQAELTTIDGETVKIPESSNGKWTIISFVPTAAGDGYIQRFATFIGDRPSEDVHLISAVLDDDVDTARNFIKAKEEEQKKRRRQPDAFPTLLVPGGLENPIVRKLGILDEQNKPNVLVLRPDGSIAVMLSGLTMSAQKANVVQNVIELHDEKLVDEALAKGDLEEAKRIAFAHAPLEEPTKAGEKKKKPIKISEPHLRSRAKVYQAMGNLEAALADAEAAYLLVNSQAGQLSMRTDELEETEALRDAIASALIQKK